MAHELFAVTGRPVLHSRSPALFHAGFDALGVNHQYLRLSARTASEAIETASQMNLRGMNVTSPHKEKMVDLVDCADDSSRVLRAVNTILADGHRWHGFNTDPMGVVGAVRQEGLEIEGSRVLVMGAGGAGRAAVYGLVNAGAQVTLVNRTFSKARYWAEKLGCSVVDAQSLKASLTGADLVVSCLPAGASLIDPSWLNPRSVVLEADYSEALLSKHASEAGCKTIDGRLWLVHQALAGFRIMLRHDLAFADLYGALGTEPVGKVDKIALIGFMGAGKSSVGRALAQVMGMDFVDTDELIQESAGSSIPEIFRSKGEAGFRKMEQESLGRVFEQKACVVACGGGAVLSAQNRALLQRSGIVVWLWAPFEVCMNRADNGARPLLDGQGAKSRAEALFAKRLSLYASCSDVLFPSYGSDLDEIAGAIADEVRGIWKNRR